MQSLIGSYERFETPNKKEAAVLLGPDNTIGDVDTIASEYLKDHHEAWMISRFNQRLGYFEPNFSRQLAVRKSEGLTNVGILSLVAYTDNPDPGHYWGEALVVSYDPAVAAYQTFVEALADLIAEGKRPAADWGDEAINQVLESGGTWLPEGRVPLPDRQKGTVWMKKHRSLSEKMIEKGRQRSIGCYVVSWAFLLALVALVVWGVYSCVGF